MEFLPQTTFIQRVQLNNERFTDFETSFATALCTQPQYYLDRTVASIAQEYHISPNAIMRFAKKLGYSGYSELRFCIEREIPQGISQTSNVVNAQTTSREALINNIQHTLEFAHVDAIKAFAKRLRKANEILVFAVGETAYIAHAYARRFNEFDDKTQFITYENQLRRELKRSREAVLVLVSLSGESKQIIAMAREALETQTPILAITDLHHSTLSILADEVLFCQSPLKTFDDMNLTDLVPLAAVWSLLEQEYIRLSM